MFRLYWVLSADDLDECVGGCVGPVDYTPGVQPSFWDGRHERGVR